MVGNPPSETPGGRGDGGRKETPHSARWWPWDSVWSHLKWSRTTLESRREAPACRDPFPRALQTQLNITLAAKEKCLHGWAPQPQIRSWSIDLELVGNKLKISPKKKSRVGQKVHLGFAIRQYGKLKTLGPTQYVLFFPLLTVNVSLFNWTAPSCFCVLKCLKFPFMCYSLLAIPQTSSHRQAFHKCLSTLTEIHHSWHVFERLRLILDFKNTFLNLNSQGYCAELSLLGIFLQDLDWNSSLKYGTKQIQL